MKLIETVYGRDEQHWTPYLTRIGFSRLCVHVFHRGDNDPDYHDHMWWFVTLPFTTYLELVMDPSSGIVEQNIVRAWRLHYRPATYRHRVVQRCNARGELLPGQIVTLCLKGRKSRAWGFWVRRTLFIPWRTYIYGEPPGGGLSAAQLVLLRVFLDPAVAMANLPATRERDELVQLGLLEWVPGQAWSGPHTYTATPTGRMVLRHYYREA